MTQNPTNTISLDKEIIYHFGLDHLEAYANIRNPHLFGGMDFENSNYIEFQGYTVVKHQVDRYEAKYVYMRENIPFFAYYVGQDREDSGISTKSYICAYASAFRVLGPEKVQIFMYANFEPELGLRSPVRRFDICMDILSDIESVLATFRNTNQKGAIFYGSDGKIETRYIGEKMNSKNKRHLIRLYDKLRDILQKNKHKLYSDYLLQNHVTRVEVEFRRELAQNVSPDDLFNPDILLGLFKNYLEKHTGIFADLEGESITLYRKRETIDYKAIQSSSRWNQRKKLLVSYAESLMGIGVCPVEILILAGHIQPRTILGLGYEDYTRFKIASIENERFYDTFYPDKDGK